jgi:hypothetical protein
LYTFLVFLHHFSLVGFLLSFNMFFLHLLEQKYNMVPSFLTNMSPVPGGTSFPQNEHETDLNILSTVFSETSCPSYNPYPSMVRSVEEGVEGGAHGGAFGFLNGRREVYQSVL